MTESFLEQVSELSRASGQPAAGALRPFPTRKDEAWRMTNLRPLSQISLAAVAPAFELSLSRLQPDGSSEVLTELPKGLKVRQGLNEWPDELRAGSSYTQSEFYEDIPQLFPERSVHITVEESYSNELPLMLNWSLPARSAENALELAPLLIFWELAPGAALSCTRSFVFNGTSLPVVREYFSLGRDAKIEQVSRSQGAASFFLESKVAKVSSGANFTHLTLDLTQAYARRALSCQLMGEGASCHLLGALGLSGSAISDHPIVMDHVAAHTVSNLLLKNVLSGTSRAVVNGKVIIRQDAQKVDSSQYNKNLLLSQGAYIHTKPELQVAADDVKAAHGATTGQVSEEEVFYLKSRGITEQRARQMISHGFLGEVLEALPNPILRKWSQQQLEQALPQVMAEGDHGAS